MRGGKASYDQARVHLLQPREGDRRATPVLTKSGIIVGARRGERRRSSRRCATCAASTGVDVVTIGQYLQPSPAARGRSTAGCIPTGAPHWSASRARRSGSRSVFSGSTRALELPRRRAAPRGRHGPRRLLARWNGSRERQAGLGTGRLACLVLRRCSSCPANSVSRFNQNHVEARVHEATVTRSPPGSRWTRSNSAPTTSAHGIVRHHAPTMFPATPQFVFRQRRSASVPRTLPVTTWVVETGKPRCAVVNRTAAVADLAEHPAAHVQLRDAMAERARRCASRPRRCPGPWPRRRPQTPPRSARRSVEVAGTSSASVITPIVFCASFAPCAVRRRSRPTSSWSGREGRGSSRSSQRPTEPPKISTSTAVSAKPSSGGRPPRARPPCGRAVPVDDVRAPPCRRCGPERARRSAPASSTTAARAARSATFQDDPAERARRGSIVERDALRVDDPTADRLGRGRERRERAGEVQARRRRSPRASARSPWSSPGRAIALAASWKPFVKSNSRPEGRR